jgi:hypothetical protein
MESPTTSGNGVAIYNKKQKKSAFNLTITHPNIFYRPIANRPTAPKVAQYSFQ